MRRSVSGVRREGSAAFVFLAMAAATLNVLCNPFSPIEYLRRAARPGAELRPTAADVGLTADLDELLAIPARVQPTRLKDGPPPFASTMPSMIATAPPSGPSIALPPADDPGWESWRLRRLRC